MSLAIFDLDLTLLTGDSDYEWGEFLISKNLVDQNEYYKKREYFYRAYENGTLDVHDYLAFSLQFLTKHPMQQLLQWREEFVRTRITPLISEKAKALVAQHKTKGDELLIITATNYFITEPIAKLFNIEHLIAPMPEIIDNRYTGKTIGNISFAEGKVLCLQEWLKEHPHELSQAFFYSDSRNDLPLLRRVGNPVAVNPDATLKEEAEKQNWKILYTVD